MALAPLIIRWGADTDNEVLRQRAKCNECGHTGATLQHPSWAGSDVGVMPFPVDRMSPIKGRVDPLVGIVKFCVASD